MGGGPRRTGGGAAGRGFLDPDRLAGVVANTGLSYRVSGQSFLFKCPLCSKPDKLAIRRSDGRFVCWFCRGTERRFSGAPEFAFAPLLGITVSEARRLLYGGEVNPNPSRYLDLTFDDDVEDEEDVVEVGDPPVERVYWEWHCWPITHKNSEEGVAYLEGRGIPVEVADIYGIRYSNAERAVAIPVRLGGTLVGWQYRSIDPEYYPTEDGWYGKRLRYKSTKDIPRDRTLMFSERLDGVEHAVLCEGPFDALKCHLVGGNVATAGKAVGGKQLDLLLRAGVKRVYLALDPDAIGEAEELLLRLEGQVDARIVEIPSCYKDLGEMPMDEARAAILDAPPFQAGRIYLGAM